MKLIEWKQTNTHTRTNTIHLPHRITIDSQTHKIHVLRYRIPLFIFRANGERYTVHNAFGISLEIEQSVLIDRRNQQQTIRFNQCYMINTILWVHASITSSPVCQLIWMVVNWNKVKSCTFSRFTLCQICKFNSNWSPFASCIRRALFGSNMKSALLPPDNNNYNGCVYLPSELIEIYLCRAEVTLSCHDTVTHNSSRLLVWPSGAADINAFNMKFVSLWACLLSAVHESQHVDIGGNHHQRTLESGLKRYSLVKWSYFLTET